MDQNDRRMYLISRLLDEDIKYKNIDIPDDERGQKTLLRSLFNVRLPGNINKDFLSVQDEYLKNEIAQKGITDYKTLKPVEPGIYLWQGDITTLKCGAIVNATNSCMTGCWQPCHNCIDNCIHTFSGIQLRDYCAEIMRKQGFEEPTGQAKITPSFNLPCDKIIHTVGPIVRGSLTEDNKKMLSSSYFSCLKIADEYAVGSIAFCCISTGVFGFPNKEAAEIAVKTVRDYKKSTDSKIEVIFNVFKDEDLEIYRRILG